MKGIIFVNPFGVPKESIFQAERLKEEFSELGTAIDIVSDGYAVNAIVGDGTTLNFSCDFAVFLDKDKYLSACLEKAGVRLFNSHAAIRSCDDKGETYIALLGGGLNIPKTFFAPVCYSQTLPLDEKTLKNIADELGYPVVVKESFGSMGKGVYKADDFEELKAVAEKLKTKPHIYQEFLSEGSGKDVRLIVIGGKFLCAMIRENKNDFRSNVALGGVGRAFSPNAQFIAAAEKCANILGLDYCGVDLLFGKDGKPYVCEVNSNAFISEIERAYAEYIVKALSSAK